MNGLIIICIAISLCIMVLTGFNIVLTTRKNEAMLKAQNEYINLPENIDKEYVAIEVRLDEDDREVELDLDKPEASLF